MNKEYVDIVKRLNALYDKQTFFEYRQRETVRTIAAIELEIQAVKEAKHQCLQKFEAGIEE